MTNPPSVDSLASEQTLCSAISREPMKNATMRYHYYLPQEEQIYSSSMNSIRGDPDLPLFSTPFFIPFNGKTSLPQHRSHPYIAQAYNSLDRRSSERPSTPSRVSSQSNLTRIEASVSTENDHDGSRLVKRTASAPIDMFLIDISNEHVLCGQSVAMNIRHLLLDTLENHQNQSPSSPIRIEPSTTTTYAHENLLNYIPYVCERYPNVTVTENQMTKNTLHVRAPSEFSRSLGALI